MENRASCTIRRSVLFTYVSATHVLHARDTAPRSLRLPHRRDLDIGVAHDACRCKHRRADKGDTGLLSSSHVGRAFSELSSSSAASSLSD